MSQSLRRAVAAAVLMALVLPASAFAATGSASSTETLVVIQAAAISVVGLPTTVDLGSALPGDMTPDTTIGSISIVPLGGVTTWNVQLSQSALTSGANTIAASNSAWSFDKGSGYGSFINYNSLPTNVFDSSLGMSTFGLKTHWSVPAGSVAGSYTGSLTLTATGN